MVEKVLFENSKIIVMWNGEHSKRKVLKWALGGSYGVCDSDKLGFRLVCKIGRWQGPWIGVLLEFILVDRVQDIHKGQEFCMTRLDWVGTRLNQFKFFEEH